MVEHWLCSALEFRDNALGQYLAQFDAPLVKCVDVPDDTLLSGFETLEFQTVLCLTSWGSLYRRSRANGRHFMGRGEDEGLHGCFLYSFAWPTDIRSDAREAHARPGGPCPAVKIWARNANNSSAVWKRRTWPEVRCSTRPAQASGVSVGWS
jgi:hypothetical protein